jgi:hypothetical protein
MKRWVILFGVAVMMLSACDLDTKGGLGSALGGKDRSGRASERREAREERRLDRQRERRRDARVARLEAQEAAREARQERRREERQARREARQEEEQAVAAAEEPSCTDGYDPCLVPAADYDCAGGTGDGPAYTGYVTVSGSDPYDLDSDDDGAGCEP